MAVAWSMVAAAAVVVVAVVRDEHALMGRRSVGLTRRTPTWDWRQGNWHSRNSRTTVILTDARMSRDTHGNIPCWGKQLRTYCVSTGGENLREKFQAKARVGCSSSVLRQGVGGCSGGGDIDLFVGRRRRAC